MKKLILSFLVAGMLITSAWSLNSCKKTTNANDEEWVPSVDDFITYEFITSEEIQDEEDRDSYIECTYCGFHIPACPHDPPYVNKCHYCPEHSHIHWFEANENCYSPNQVGECQYKFVRRHRHVITYAPLSGYYWHSFHAGGAGGGHE
jgi:hypothetical protein